MINCRQKQFKGKGISKGGKLMNKLKDLVYDYNDLFVALVIVVIAGVLIFWRIGTIMNYPEYLAQAHAGDSQEASDLEDLDLTPAEVEDMNENPEEIVTDPAEGTEAEVPETEPEAETPTASEVFTTKTEVKFTVPTGVTGSKIALLLYEAKLVESAEIFLTTVSRMNAETKLMAGTFKIPAGSTVEDIVDILTR